MKEIWINLELYFKRYDFYNFMGFFWIFSLFFLFNFYLKTLKINIKKLKKGARDPRGCDVARKATWQRHADPRSAYVARIYYIILLLLYIIKGFFSLA